eukprot:TRINITY_DN6802_c0_g1_i3.p1 TRINITY_DN6802_c0_g1~~TRINITY_DN6802_c0_g1_i3.p1  ORF type:complete len:430 (-),score=99.89 TRINITY_DN6802_c0_g1_i3:1-1269(-)
MSQPQNDDLHQGDATAATPAPPPSLHAGNVGDLVAAAAAAGGGGGGGMHEEEEVDADVAFARKLQEELDKADAAAAASIITTTPKLNAADALLAVTLQAQYDKETIQPTSTLPPSLFSFPHYTPSPSSAFLQPPQQPPAMPQEKLPPNAQKPTPGCIKRIRSDLEKLMKHPNPSIHVAPHEEDLTHMEALIIGPDDTPYAGGMFHFEMRFPHDYPWNPPKVLLRTTDSGRTRFNPNLYANGKVCLSILGTWEGPGWRAVQTLESVLVSVQSLMNAAPYHNEPGYENERHPHESKNYNECIIHETLRVAVCGMMEAPTSGPVFQDIMDKVFMERYTFYKELVTRKLVLDGKHMKNPFGDQHGVFKYQSIMTRLEAIKEKLEKQHGPFTIITCSSSSSTTSSPTTSSTSSGTPGAGERNHYPPQ